MVFVGRRRLGVFAQVDVDSESLQVDERIESDGTGIPPVVLCP